jgi:hypothetical protein
VRGGTAIARGSGLWHHPLTWAGEPDSTDFGTRAGPHANTLDRTSDVGKVFKPGNDGFIGALYLIRDALAVVAIESQSLAVKDEIL